MAGRCDDEIVSGHLGWCAAHRDVAPVEFAGEDVLMIVSDFSGGRRRGINTGYRPTANAVSEELVPA